MTTLKKLRTKIAKELGRYDEDTGLSDIDADIDEAINAVVLDYGRERFQFNETRARLYTREGVDEYTYDTMADIDALLMIRPNQGYPLRRLAWLEYIKTRPYTNRATPLYYAIYGCTLFVHPIPNGVYQLEMHYVKAQQTLIADDDTNDFLIHAADLIKAAAKRELCGNRLQWPEMMSAMAAMEDRIVRRLRSKNDTFSEVNETTPTQF